MRFWMVLWFGLVQGVSWAVTPPVCRNPEFRNIDGRIILAAVSAKPDSAVCLERAGGARDSVERTRLSLALAGGSDETHGAVKEPGKDLAKAAPVAVAKTAESVQVWTDGAWAALTRESQTAISKQTIESTAGTFGDPSRYLQLLPGVVSDNDQRNDVLVRGGNPSENLFVVDGIVVPSINHLALSDTTGGFVSMIDNEAIEDITLHSGVHDARFDDRLSSVVEISTVPEEKTRSRRIMEAGLEGVGGVTSRSLGANGTLLISGRRSIMNLLTNDIGMNGVPIYTNFLARGDKTYGTKDRVWGMSLTGIDSMVIRPSDEDEAETNPFNIDYSGWRNTTGLNWQHALGGSSFFVGTVSNSEQSQSIDEFDQLLSDRETYRERTRDGDATAKGEVTAGWKKWLLFNGGGTISEKRVDYEIAQPVPLPNPYSLSPVSKDATAISQHFWTGSQGGFAQGTLVLPKDLRLTMGLRAEHWGFGGNTSVTPRVLLSAPLKGHLLSLGYAEYKQMPSFLYLLAFPQNHGLTPIKAEHLTADADVLHTSRVKLALSGYRKLYFDYPVSQTFRQLSMANIADTFGESFLLFPMVSGGRGRVAGAEASGELRLGSRLVLAGTGTYARSWYSGLDGVLRRGNFDIPLVANGTALVRIRKTNSFSVRYSAASGRPYTPDNLRESVAQDRDVYDLTRVNADRSTRYERMDVRFQQTRRVRIGELSWNAGLLNVLNQKNFYQYLWMPRAKPATFSEQDQMPRFPEGDVKLVF